jgi:hypothetical protein
MRRRISSSWTPLMKLLTVPVIAVVVVLILTSMLRHSLTLFPDGVTGLAFTLAALGFFLWYSSRLKFVSLDHDHLYVSGLLKRCAIPISDMDGVHYSGSVGLVFIRLKSPSEFGYTIAFMPTLGAGILAKLGSRSVVEELRDLATKATTRSESPT